MVTEYFITTSKVKDLTPNLYCFKNPRELEKKVNEVFSENCVWSESNSNGKIFLEAFYQTELAYIKINILKTNSSPNYICQLTVLGGENPLIEVVRLCKINSWNAFDLKAAEYLSLQNPAKLSISNDDKKDYYDDYWDKFNEAQEQEESKSFSKNKKWWKFW
jgi:hypothetical protein